MALKNFKKFCPQEKVEMMPLQAWLHRPSIKSREERHLYIQPLTPRDHARWGELATLGGMYYLYFCYFILLAVRFHSNGYSFSWARFRSAFRSLWFPWRLGGLRIYKNDRNVVCTVYVSAIIALGQSENRTRISPTVSETIWPERFYSPRSRTVLYA